MQYDHNTPSAAPFLSSLPLQQPLSIAAPFCSQVLPPLPRQIGAGTPPCTGDHDAWVAAFYSKFLTAEVLGQSAQPGQPAFIALPPSPDAPAPIMFSITPPGSPARLSLDQLLQTESGQEADSDLE